MTITGTGFPKDAFERVYYASGDARDTPLSVTVGGETCTVRPAEVTSTQIRCIIPTLTSAANANVIVTINTKASNEQAVTKGSTPNVLLSADAYTASPVDKINIGLTLDTGATLPATNDDFIGMLVNSDETYKMRITAYDRAAGTATMKYPGAIRGTYNFYLADNTGNSLSTSQTFTSDSTMVSVSP